MMDIEEMEVVYWKGGMSAWAPRLGRDILRRQHGAGPFAIAK